MNILIISDSHGRGEYVEEAIRRVRPDAILFAGDGLRDFSHMKLPCPLYAVKGNCDWAIGDPYIAQYEDEALVTLWRERGIRVQALSSFYAHGAPPEEEHNLVICYAGIREEVLRERFPEGLPGIMPLPFAGNPV